ncbi:MAG TPA: DUF6702 family protein [Candidatus Kapabacteria bacterium]|nr:DUF6702 family protein [Candidatus Kapabacteria bacterium]
MLIALLLSVFSFHSIHISYGKIDVGANNIHVKVSYYKDDYLKAVSNWYSVSTEFFSEKQTREAELHYFNEYFRLWTAAGFTHQLQIASSKVTEDGTSIIFEVEYSSEVPITMLTIDHRVIHKEYSDQSNIMTVHIFGADHNVISSSTKPTTTLRQ